MGRSSLGVATAVFAAWAWSAACDAAGSGTGPGAGGGTDPAGEGGARDAAGDAGDGEAGAGDAGDGDAGTGDTDAGDTDAGDADAGDAAGPDATMAERGAAVQASHAGLFDAVRATLADPALCVDGDWQQHYGDAPMYGPAFDLRYWAATGDEAALERGLLTLARNRELVEQATANPLMLTSDMEVVAMSLLGLVEAARLVEDDAAHAAADALLDLVDAMAKDLGDYLELEGGVFAPSTYGPTSISSFVALAHAEHLLAWPADDPAHHQGRLLEVLGHIRDEAWDPALGAYRFAPGDTRLTLYPNVTMMLAWARAAQLTGDPAIAAHLSAIRQGVEPLRDEDGDHWHSPYSAQAMGALDDDYSTLSSQNYLMLAFGLAARVTGDPTWLDDVDRVLGFLEDRLLVDGRILHHWMNGKHAQPTDPEYYCAGCNLQTLYALMLLGAEEP